MRKRLPKKIILLLILLLIGAACNFPTRPISATRAPTSPPESRTTDSPAPTLPANAPNEEPTAQSYSCDYQPGIHAMLAETSTEAWMDWIARLSGEKAIEIGDQKTTLQTRYTPAMFSDQPDAQAFKWLKQQLSAWYPQEQIEEQSYHVEQEGFAATWKNLVLTLPGVTSPDEIVVIAAHLDSTSEDPLVRAPGAEDNGSGAAALLEAARLFRDRSFERTIQIVWFTGEEQGLLGSKAFTAAVDPDQVIGVVNLDMFGFDSDNDRCFELHVGTLPASQAIGECFTQTITAYHLDLTYDYLTTTATSRSDHGSFWRIGVGAVEVLEDLFESDLENGCPASDPNPDYHTTQDVITNLNPETGFSILQAALATTAAMAMPVEPP